jgi:hypothetical protein
MVLNNLRVATIVAGIVARMVNGTVGGAGHIGAWCVLGADLTAPTSRPWPSLCAVFGRRR